MAGSSDAVGMFGKVRDDLANIAKETKLRTLPNGKEEENAACRIVCSAQKRTKI
jgi:hypothetical protein